MARNWTRKILSKFKCFKRKTNLHIDPPISEWQPIASRRQFTLTPSSSTTAFGGDNATNVTNSPFFRLPGELQLKILKHAFGNRIFHIELSQDAPQRLLGYICPRSSMEPRRCPNDIIDDECLWVRPPNRDYGPERDPRRATVGALGWLTSCRKAYVIGIDVLYASNTFFLEDKDTALHLDKFILPQRSQAITRVEMIWKLQGQGLITDHEILQDLRERLAIPARVFPSIQDLYISFNSEVYSSVDVNTMEPSTYVIVHEQFLPLLDGMVRGLPASTKEINIAMPIATFYATTGIANGAGATFDETSPRSDFRLRRPLPPAKWKDGTSEPGYWLIRSGFRPFRHSCGPCFFGTGTLP